MWQWLNKKDDKAQSFRPQFPPNLGFSCSGFIYITASCASAINSILHCDWPFVGTQKERVVTRKPLCLFHGCIGEPVLAVHSCIGSFRVNNASSRTFSKESGAEGRAVKALLSFSHISYQTKQREFMLYPHKGDVQTTCHWRNPFHDTETFRLPLRADRHNAFRTYQRCSAPAVPPRFCCALASVGRIGIVQDLYMPYCWIYILYF